MNHLRILFLLVTLQNIKVFCRICTTLVDTDPVLNGDGRPCSSARSCATKMCQNNVCVCPHQTYFDHCTRSCVASFNTNITSFTGVISMPDHGPLLQNSYTWTITGKSSLYIAFRFTNLDFSPQCSENFIDIFNGRSNLLKRVCNNTDLLNSSFISSPDDTMKIVVKSMSEKNTFTGIYTIYNKDFNTRDTFGYITSPGFPYANPQYSQSTWTFRGQHLALRFLDLPFEGCSDYIKIYKGTTNTSEPFNKVCKQTSPVIITATNILHIVLSSSGTPTYKGFSAVFHQRELDYGNLCDLTISGMCKGPDLVCRYNKYMETKCLCRDGYYRERNICFNKSVSVVQPLTTSVMISMVANVRFFSHFITWSAVGECRDRGESKYGDSNFVHIHGLTPGQEYLFKLFSDLQSFSDETFKSNFTVVTLPDEPGEILKERSDLKKPPYTIKFQPSGGVVDHYNVTFESSSVTFTYQVESAELITSDLEPGTQYNYTIVAFNKLGNSSQAFESNITIEKVMEEEVSFPVAVVVGTSVGAITVITIIVVITVTALKRRHRRKRSVTMDKLNDNKTSKTKESISEDSPYSNVRIGDHNYDALHLGKLNQEQHGNIETPNDDDIYGNGAAIRQAIEDDACYEVFN